MPDKIIDSKTNLFELNKVWNRVANYRDTKSDLDVIFAANCGQGDNLFCG